MKKSLSLGLAFAALMLITSPALHAVTIIQGSGENYVKFQAGDYDSLNNTVNSVITDNGDGTLTTTSRNDSSPATLTFSLTFDAAGDYYLYFRSSAPNISSDSFFVINEFGSTPTTTTSNNWNNLFQSGSGQWTVLDNGSGGNPGGGAGVGLSAGGAASGEYAGGGAINEFFTVSAGQVGTPVTLIFRPREAGLVWQDFVLSTDADLTATELNELDYSAIPEPTSAALLLGALCVAMLQRRRMLRL